MMNLLSRWNEKDIINGVYPLKIRESRRESVLALRARRSRHGRNAVYPQLRRPRASRLRDERSVSSPRSRLPSATWKAGTCQTTRSGHCRLGRAQFLLHHLFGGLAVDWATASKKRPLPPRLLRSRSAAPEPSTRACMLIGFSRLDI